MFEFIKKIPDPLISLLKDLLTTIDTTENSDPPRFWMWVYIISFILPLIVAGVLLVGLPHIGLVAEINADSAKSTLSTIIQSQVSIIAIVIAISLVAIELSITKYGKEVFEIFKQHPAMWLLLVSYILSILLNTVLLLSIFQTTDGIITAEIKVFSIYYSISLFFMLVIILLPHFRTTMNQLHTDRVFLGLIEHIKVSNLKPQDDPFQAIFSIIYSAIEKNDFQTMSDLMTGCKNKYIEIMNAESRSLNKQYISFRFFDDIQRTTFIPLAKNETKFVFEILTRTKEICDNSLERNERISFNDGIQIMGKIGANSLNLTYKQNAYDSLSALTEYYDKSKTNTFFKPHLSVFSKSLYDIGVIAISKNDRGFAGHIFLQLKRIISDNAESNEPVAINAIFQYCQLVNKSVEAGIQQFYNEGLTFLTEINSGATEREQRNLIFISKSELDSIKAIKDYYMPAERTDGVEFQ